jgi:hypothetical protein
LKAFRRSKLSRGNAKLKPETDLLDDGNSSQECLLEQFVSEDMRHMLELILRMGIPKVDLLDQVPPVDDTKAQFSDDEDSEVVTVANALEKKDDVVIELGKVTTLINILIIIYLKNYLSIYLINFLLLPASF